MRTINPRTPSALFVAHPSHELRLHGWLREARPAVFVLTDGRGRAGEPRIDSTAGVVELAGAKKGSVFGRLKDAEVYAALLEGDFGLFVGLAEELAEEFVKEGVEYVVGDAAEGFSPAHDACRAVLDAAVELASCARRASWTRR